MKNYTIRKLSLELHRELRIMAAEKGRTIQDLIIEALERYVKKERTTK